MNSPEKRQDLDFYFNNETFVLKTIEQITKDLGGLESANIQFKVDMDGDVLKQLVDLLSGTLLKMNNRNIQQFIYTVDVKERDFLKAIAKEDDFQELAYLIVRREAQKVYLRAKFS